MKLGVSAGVRNALSGRLKFFFFFFSFFFFLCFWRLRLLVKVCGFSKA